jgi:SsrA-binding protein
MLMAKKKSNQPKSIKNRRASYDYALGDSVVVGMELKGGEVKALRMGHGQLRGAYVTIKGGELFLINATISGTKGIIISESDQTRPRKLLAKKREIDNLMAVKQEGKTIVPLEIMTRGRFIKLRIALGKGKKRYDKREAIKKRESDRRIQYIEKRS